MAKITTQETVSASVGDVDKTTGEIAKVVTHGTAVANVPDEIDFSADAGVGLEGTNKDDYAIPFLAILQGLSPAVVDGVEGARPGLIMNSVTMEFTEDVLVVPCAFQRRFLEWAPRNKGGGFKGEHLPIDVESGKVGEEYVDNTGTKRLGIKVEDKEKGTYWHDLKDTRSHYVLVVKEDGTFSPAVVSFASTQVKKSKRWLAMIQGVQERNAAGQLFQAPSFSRLYQLFSVKESNERGSWNGWSIGALGKVKSRELYDAAKAFNTMVLAGAVKVQHEDPNVVDAASEGAGSDSPNGSF